MSIGEAIRNIRTRAGLSQSEFAEMLFTQRAAVARWESGKVIPSFPNLVRLMKSAQGTEEEIPISSALGRLYPIGDISQKEMVEAVFPSINELELTSTIVEALVKYSRQGAAPFAMCAAAVMSRCLVIDHSVSDIVSLWANQWENPNAARHFRDAEAYLRVQFSKDDTQSLTAPADSTQKGGRAKRGPLASRNPRNEGGV